MSDAASQSRASVWGNPHWRAIVAAFALNGFLFGVWAARIPAFKADFSLEPGTLGILLLALAGGAIVSFPFAGALSERIGPERLTIYCAWGYVPALVALALAPTPVTLGLLLFIFGAFHGAMDVAMNGWGARVEKMVGRTSMSVFHAMFSLGAGLGAASGFLALGANLEPLEHFALAASVMGAIAIYVMMMPKIPAQEQTKTGDKKPLFTLPPRSLLLIGLIAFSVSMGEGAMADWSAVFLHTVALASEAQASLGYAAFSIMMVMTRLAGGKVVDRFGPVATTRGSAAIAFSGILIVVLLPYPMFVLAGFAFMGVGYAVVIPIVFSRAAQDPVIPPGPGIAGVATLGYGGMLLGPPIIGFIAQVTGLRLSFLVLAGLALLAFFLAARLKPTG